MAQNKRSRALEPGEARGSMLVYKQQLFDIPTFILQVPMAGDPNLILDFKKNVPEEVMVKDEEV